MLPCPARPAPLPGMVRSIAALPRSAFPAAAAAAALLHLGHDSGTRACPHTIGIALLLVCVVVSPLLPLLRHLLLLPPLPLLLLLLLRDPVCACPLPRLCPCPCPLVTPLNSRLTRSHAVLPRYASSTASAANVPLARSSSSSTGV